MEHVKIQINSLEALERLIGGNSEIEFDIRQSVVEAFSKKHLKSLANQDLMNNTLAAIKKQVSDEFVHEIKSGSWSKQYALTTKATELIQQYIEPMIKSSVEQLIKDAIGRTDMQKMIDEKLKKQAEYITAELTNETLERRLNDMVNTRIKQRLGLK